MRHYLRDVREEVHPAGTIYDVGRLPLDESEWEVALVQTGAGNVAAALEVERAVGTFKPRLAFFMGVAGGLKDVALGDVVAATKVYGYEAGKADVQFKPRLDFGHSTYDLEQVAKAVARQDEWQRHIPPSLDSSSDQKRPSAFVAPIAAGEKVVSSVEAPVYRLIKQNCSDALAVEMESYGFLSAVRASVGVSALVVRGISDLVEGKTEADATGSQFRASNHAAAFTIAVLAKYASLYPSPATVSINSVPMGKLEEDDWWRKLTALAAQLYPHGPEDRHIWERAGGDVARLETSASSHATWFGALRALRQGGGGRSITPSLLIETMFEDYPQNDQLLNL